MAYTNLLLAYNCTPKVGISLDVSTRLPSEATSLLHSRYDRPHNILLVVLRDQLHLLLPSHVTHLAEMGPGARREVLEHQLPHTICCWCHGLLTPLDNIIAYPSIASIIDDLSKEI